MARLPSSRNLGSAPLPRAVSQPLASADAFGAAEAQAMGGAGQAIQSAGFVVADKMVREGQRIEEERKRSEDFQTQMRFEQLINDKSRELDAAGKEIEPGGSNFSGSLIDEFDNSQKEFLASIPDRLQDEYKLRLQRSRNTYRTIAEGYEFKERDRFDREVLGNRLQDLEGEIARDPSGATDFVKAGIKAIDAAPISNTDKAALKRQFRQDAEYRRESARVQSDVEYAKLYANPGRKAIVTGLVNSAREAGLDPVMVLALVDRETAGTFDPNIKPIGKDGKPLSSAVGLGQFIDGTWKGEGGGDRLDPNEQIRVLINFTKKNKAKAAKILGRAPTDAEIYSMHMLGSGNGPRLLKADPDALLSDTLQDWNAIRRANGLKSDATVGDYLGKVAADLGRRSQKFAGIARDGVDEAMSPEGFDRVSNQAGVVVNRAERALTKEAKAAIKAEKLAVADRADDSIAYFKRFAEEGFDPEAEAPAVLADSEIELLTPAKQDEYRRERSAAIARADAWSTDLDEAEEYLSSIAPEGEGFEEEAFAHAAAVEVIEERREKADVATHIAASVAAGRAVNMKRPGVSDQMDLMFNEHITQVEASGAPASSAVLGFVKQTGVVPPAGADLLGTMMRSENESDRVEAVRTIKQINTERTEALNDLPSSLVERGLLMSDHLDTGLTWQEASRLADQQMSRDPAKLKQQRANADLLDDDETDDVLEDIADGADLDQRARGDLQDLYEQHVIAYGNPAAAKTFVAHAFQRSFAKTGIGGTEYWQKNAPERVYQLYDGGDLDTAWMQEQLDDRLADAGIEANNIKLEPVGMRGAPAYEVFAEVNGEMQNLSMGEFGLWTPDQQAEIDAAKVRSDAADVDARFEALTKEKRNLELILKGVTPPQDSMVNTLKLLEESRNNPEKFQRRLDEVNEELAPLTKSRKSAREQARAERKAAADQRRREAAAAVGRTIP